MKNHRMLLLLAAMLILLLTSAVAEEPTHTLVVYFSRVGNTDFPSDVDANSTASIVVQDGSVMGNTGFMAQRIAEVTGGDLFLIETAHKYPVSYDETVDLGADENAAASRPELAAYVKNLDQYDTIFLGYPIWWYDMPMAVYSFLESYDLNGKTIIPFATSGGSGFSGSIEVIESMFPEAEMRQGLLLSGSRVLSSIEQIDQWLTELDLQ